MEIKESKVHNDGTLHNAIIRKLKLLTVSEALCNGIGFLFILLQSYYFEESQQFMETMTFIFTLLILIEMCLYGTSVYWSWRQFIIFNPREEKMNLLTIIKSFNIWEVMSGLLLFFQPCIIYTSEINEHLFSLTLVRIYLLFSLFFDYNLKRDPRLKRTSHTLGCDFYELTLKAAFSSEYFNYKIVSILFFVLFGLGNIIKNYEDDLHDVYEVVYFIFTTMSTVGYGDIVLESTFSRFLCVICILMGNFISALFAYKILSSSKLNYRENKVRDFEQKINNTEQKKTFFIRRMEQDLNAKEPQKHPVDDQIPQQFINNMPDSQKQRLQDICMSAPMQDQSDIFVLSTNSQKRMTQFIRNCMYHLQHLSTQYNFKDKKRSDTRRHGQRQ